MNYSERVIIKNAKEIIRLEIKNLLNRRLKDSNNNT